MAAFSVTNTTSPSSCLLQPHPSSSSSYPLVSVPYNRKFGVSGMLGLPFNRRRRRTLMRAVNQDAEEATVETDSPIRKTDSYQDGRRTTSTVWDPSIEAWSQFAIRVSGEWDGFGADFSNEGKAIELPESVVPETYREWEVQVFDWQTQCPTLAEPNERVLQYKSIQLLPTVGCEADAATQYSVDERKVGEGNSGLTAFAYQSSGSYVAVWQKKDNLLEFECCMVNPQDCESRVRVIQFIHVLNNTEMVLQGIRVFRERWYGPFRNGDQLGGCAMRDSAFAATAPMIASDVAGIWKGSTAVASVSTSNTGIFQELFDEKVQDSVRDGDSNILLPKQLWCSLKQSKEGETLSEVGWLLDHGQAITSSCLFSKTAKPQEISIALETRALEYA
ncbi:hypothetical protein LR48_Vigan02g221000 [Vigna angularis]|uniref:Uncharacterized protein n=3 Tax=Phaseolus angularis TaxID=3914 RepID=A0A0L9TZU7_PHAAN|nr:uncharacterized protein LOC108324099 isoform X1 [Vigna angularis]KAG2401484.1 uncharacterized protein HKW66_Vig0194800 [Vigna angularis]KOM36060.1 hypothetical protein LR48_Vigan02g221000 [Vigna angularis]BAT94119.1 hypothetical protein VIGAN_08069200 [Vigna angularis var. angularis]